MGKLDDYPGNAAGERFDAPLQSLQDSIGVLVSLCSEIGRHRIDHPGDDARFEDPGPVREHLDALEECALVIEAPGQVRELRIDMPQPDPSRPVLRWICQRVRGLCPGLRLLAPSHLYKDV